MNNESTYVIKYFIRTSTGEIVNDPTEVLLPNGVTIDEHLDDITHQICSDDYVDWESHYTDRVEFTIYNESPNILMNMREYIQTNPTHFFYNYHISFTGVYLSGEEEEEVKDPGYE